MAKQTYRIESNRNMTYCPDLPLTSVAGHPYNGELTAGLALYNRVGSGKIVRVVDIAINRYSTSSDKMYGASAGMRSQFGRTTTNHDSGEVITPKAVDSNAAAIPSQIVIKEALTHPSAGAGDFLRYQLITHPLFLNTLALSHFAQRGANNLNTIAGRLFNDAVTRETQLYSIRENEGFVVLAGYPSGADIDCANLYDLVVVFKIGTDIYEAYSNKGPVAPMNGQHSFAMQIWNGTGSGVVIEIVDVYYLDCGEMVPSSGAPPIEDTRVEKISYMDPDNHEDCSILAMDSNNEDLTGLIDAGTNARVHIEGARNGSLIQRDLLRRFVMTGTTMRVNTAPLGPFLNFGGNEGDFIPGVSEVVLREGEGIAIFDRNTTMIGRRRRILRFLVEDVPVSGGGEYGYAF